jgi:hypothetical protein
MYARTQIGPLLSLLMTACTSSDVEVQPDARVDAGGIDFGSPDVRRIDAAVDSSAMRNSRGPNVVDRAWSLPGCMTSKLPPRGPQGEFLEFCIPNQDAYLSEVRGILDPLREQTGFLSQNGRIGCMPDTQYLIVLPSAIDAEPLCALTQLGYVERIAWTVINI